MDNKRERASSLGDEWEQAVKRLVRSKGATSPRLLAENLASEGLEVPSEKTLRRRLEKYKVGNDDRHPWAASSATPEEVHLVQPVLKHIIELSSVTGSSIPTLTQLQAEWICRLARQIPNYLSRPAPPPLYDPPPGRHWAPSHASLSPQGPLQIYHLAREFAERQAQSPSASVEDLELYLTLRPWEPGGGYEVYMEKVSAGEVTPPEFLKLGLVRPE